MEERVGSTAAQSPLADDLSLARTIAWIARDTPGISGVSTGRHAEAATYGPGDSVRGVAVLPGEVNVHVVAAYPSVPLPRTAERLRSRIAAHVNDRDVNIYIDDLAEEGA